MRRILVTGGSGFLGTWLLKALKQRGYEPVVYDLNSPRLDVEHVPGSVLDRTTLREAAADCQGLIHLASMVGVANTEARTRETLDTIIEGSRNAVDAAPGGPYVLASSSEVYGNARNVPTSEDEPPSPVSAYGAAKLAAEYYWSATPRFASAGTILRFFSVYGPGQRPEFVIPRFVQQAVNGHRLNVFGTGNQVRAFLHVEDAATAIALAFERAEARGRTINIGNASEPVSMLQLARMIAAEVKPAAEITMTPFEASDRTAAREIYDRTPSTLLARRLLGFQAQVPLAKGISSVFDEFRKESTQ